MNIKLEPTYTITPIFTTEGKGRKKRNIFRCIEYYFKFNRAITVKGVVNKENIESIPFLETMNIDLYEHIVNAIINEMIIQVNDLFENKMTHKDFEDFINEHQELFNTFINELKKINNEYRD